MSSEGEAPLVRNNAGMMGRSRSTGGKQLGLSGGMFSREAKGASKTRDPRPVSEIHLDMSLEQPDTQNQGI